MHIRKNKKNKKQINQVLVITIHQITRKQETCILNCMHQKKFKNNVTKLKQGNF